MKTFNCPFCKEKMRRELLVKHIEKEHDEEIPEGFTAYRLVYDIVNDHPDHMGTCTICGKPTKWNEKRQKYERLCGDPKCYAAVKKTYQKRMLKVYNKTSLMDDPNHLEKMLAGRKISGKYKWSDGKVFTYTGTYEKNFMEFLDKVLEFKSNEILAPGPVLNYEYKGKQHMWITDFLILPYNLIVEIKDGGEGENANPNMKYMPSYRKKQVAKEKMITNLGKYSYIRLTNNEFNQFLSLLAELKMNVNDQDEKPLYRIHEDACLLDENFLSGYKNNIVGEKFHHSPQKRTSVYNNIIRVFKKLKDKLERYYKTDGKNTYDSVIAIGCSNKKEYNDFINCPEDKVKGNKVSIGTFKIKKDINAPIIGKLFKFNDNKIRSELLKRLKTELDSMTKEFSIITEEKDNIIIYYLKENLGTGFHKYVEDAYLQENINIIFSDDDIVKNLDQWKKGNIKILFITGLSGSGKSTLAKKLQSKYKAEYISLDDVLNNIFKKKYTEPVIWYNKTHKEPISEIKWPKSDKEFYNTIFSIVIGYIEYKAKTSDKKLIVEGIQIPGIYEISPDLFKKSAIIIKSTSYLSSVTQGLKRDVPNIVSNFANDIKGHFGTLFSFNKRLKDKINDFENEIREDTSLAEYSLLEVEDIFEDLDDDFDNEFKRQADDMERMEKNARKVLDQLADKHSKSFVVNKTSYTTTDPDERELTVVNIYTPKVKMANKNSKKRFKEMCYSLKEELDSIHSDQYDIVSFFEDPDNVNEGYVVGIASKTSK